MGTSQGQFKIRVGVVLPLDGKILLARQNNRPFWVFPGGTLEPGEGLETCAIREIKEEAGLDIVIEKLLYLSDFIPSGGLGPDSGQTSGRQTLDVFFLGRVVSGTLQMATDENLNELDFFTPAAMAALDIQPAAAARRVLQEMAAGFREAGEPQYLGVFTA